MCRSMTFRLSMLLPLLLFLALPSLGQELKIVAPPVPVEVGEYAQLLVQGVKPEVLPYCKLIVYPRDGVQFLPGQTWTGEPYILLRSKRAATILVAVCCPASGLVGRPVKDPTPAGLAYAEVEVVVGDAAPPPPPPPPPPTPRAVQLFLIHETADNTAAFTSVRDAKAWRDKADALKIRWQVFDDDTGEKLYPNAVALARNRGLPAIVLLDQRNTPLVLPVPATPFGMIELVQKYGGESP